MTFDPHQPRDADGRWTHLAGVMKATGGFTALWDGEVPTSGYVVGVKSKSGKDWATLPHGSTDAAALEKFSQDHAAELTAAPNRGIGGWSNDNPEYGEVRDALDIVEVHKTLDGAMKAAREAGQDAIFDIGKGEEIPTSHEIDPSALRDLDYVDARLDGDDYLRQDAFRRAGTEPDTLQHWLSVYGERLDSDLYNAVQSAIDTIRKADPRMDLSIFTPDYAGTYDLAIEDGKLAFWKQVLPKKSIHYTRKDGQRDVLNFDDKYLTDLATNKAVDKVGFLLADTDNRHTMDPERFRGDVAEWKIRDDLPNPDHNGLWAKIVFPNREAAAAVLANPDLGVSARIRENIERSDGSSISRGIVHVLGTLDPQVSGMAGWQTADLSNEDQATLDLTDMTYDQEDETMAYDKTKSVTDYTEADIEAFTEDELDAYLAQVNVEFEGLLDEIEDEAKAEADKADEPVLVSLSNEAKSEIDLANSRATRALAELAQARWDKTRSAYQAAGVPPALLDLAEPIYNRPTEFVVDLSNDGSGADEIHVGEIVSKMLDALKGTIDMSNEQGHSATFHAGDGTDPDQALLDAWDKQS